ncbi:MAG: ABC transporter ATP-binding protein [Treponema sp.]|nr:ABC transporter ATP-binding protein [Treponema sp.]
MTDFQKPVLQDSSNHEPITRQPVLSARNLCARANKENKKILNNINFDINEGEILGLAGESGCGKSVTALSITGLLPQAIKITSGEIIYNGSDLLLLDEEKKRSVRGSGISQIFQDVRQALNPLMTAGDQILETLELEKTALGGSRKKERRKNNKEEVIKTLSLLGFDNPLKILGAYPHQLSGGMCQRIMTAIAVIRRPKLLLGDEMSSSLDEESRGRCMSLLLDMNQKNNMSVLLISHDLRVIKENCARFLIMYAGRIIEEGPSISLFSPYHPYAKALVNAIPNKEKRCEKLTCVSGETNPVMENNTDGCPFAPRCPKVKKICGASFPPEILIGGNKVYCYYP